MKTITLFAFVLMCSTALARAADAPLKSGESFAAVADCTSLDKLPGWSPHYGEGAAPLVLTAAGYEGAGARFSSKANFRRTLGPLPANGPRGVALEFRFKLRVMADSDAYVISQVMLGKSGGVSGLCVRFNGGTKDGREDNFIQVSDGGAGWGNTKFRNVPDSRWSKGVWYEIVITDIRPDGTGEGDPVGNVSIREIDTGGIEEILLVPDTSVARIGTGAFDKADVVIIGNAGAARIFDVDDIVLKKTFCLLQTSPPPPPPGSSEQIFFSRWTRAGGAGGRRRGREAERQGGGASRRPRAGSPCHSGGGRDARATATASASPELSSF
ncbi:MAG: hypothetical protein LBK99_18490 [Opitutaceae bacterium]|jgi:hypothetical protein|nr:hypothetical protein [Opitutaceae bacterium]